MDRLSGIRPGDVVAYDNEGGDTILQPVEKVDRVFFYTPNAKVRIKTGVAERCRGEWHRRCYRIATTEDENWNREYLQRLLKYLGIGGE